MVFCRDEIADADCARRPGVALNRVGNVSCRRAAMIYAPPFDGSARWCGKAPADFVYDNTGKPRRRSKPAWMSEAGGGIALSCSPSPSDCSGRKIGHLDGKIGGVDLMNQVQDRHCRIARL